MKFRILYYIAVFAVFFLNKECFAVLTECDAGWKENNGSCYLFHPAAPPLMPSSWSDSRLQCQLLGGELLSVRDEAEKTFIASYFGTDEILRRYHYWIGLNDIKSEGNYTWSDGTPYNLTNWRTESGEPNNYRNNEDCAETTWDGRWNDNNCDTEFGFICEKQKGIVKPTPTIPPYPNITDRPTTCEAGWVPWGTSCYGIIRGIPKSWSDARADCLRRFGDLVVIDDQNENNFLANELSRYTTEFWIGLSDKNTPNRFGWVDGTLLNNSMGNNWRPGEPSNSFGIEDCVEIYGKWLPGKWNDNHCNTKRDYICEKNSGTHNCPDGWENFNSYCYQINAHPNQKLSWADARTLCQSFSEPWKKIVDVAKADLVSITSQEEHDFVDNLFKSYKVTGYQDFYWTGLYKNLSDSGFHWSDGAVLKYQDWKNTIPGINNSCVKSALSATNRNSWTAAACTEQHYFVCKVKRGQDRCYDPVGTQDYRIPDSSFTASSQLFFTTPPSAARLYLKKQSALDGAWCAANNSQNPWLQIDFGKPEKLTYMGLQGKSNSDAFVTSFYLKYSLDGVTWETYGDIPPNLYYKFKAFVHWRTTKETVMNMPLPSPLKTRYIRIYPFRSECNIACCMRVEFYGCPEDENTQDCGVGWRKDESSKHCYQFSSTKTTWDSAESICMTQGGHLTSITSKQEREYIKNQLRPLSGQVTDYWIGLNDLEQEQVYGWSDQSPIRVTSWKRFFPSSNVKGNCISVVSADGTWSSEDCATFRNFICKKSYENPYVAKRAMNGYWPTSSDFYWKMDKKPDSSNQLTGTVPADVFGTFTTTTFNNRDYLAFDGASNYINISNGVLTTCVSHPGSDSCPHGISVVFNFKYSEPQSTVKKYLIDTLGQKADAVGFYVYIKNGRINVFLRDSDLYYLSSDSFVANSFNHFAFSWSSHDGLKTYVNGKDKSKNYGSNNFNIFTKEDVTDLIIGRSASNPQEFTKMELGSLAIFERVLPSERMYHLYLAEFGQCGLNQLEHGSHCYEFNSMEKYWGDATSDCQARGGHLASIHSSVEQAFITLKSGQLGLNQELWIGLGTKTAELDWTDETPVTYTQWKQGEPNSRSSTSCVHTIIKTGSWNDHYCFVSKGYICKFRKTVDQKKLQEKEPAAYNITVTGYSTKRFGCKLPKRIQLNKVTYGSKQETPTCFMNETLAKSIVQKNCGNYSCFVRSSDYYFEQQNPCPKKYVSTKEVYVEYQCVADTRLKAKCSGDGYELSDDGTTCYKLHLDDVTIDEANKTCKAEQASLASITSQTEQWYLTSMLSQLYAPRDIWVGMQYNVALRTYSWMDSTPVTFTKWYNKKPDPRVGQYVKVGVNDGRRSLFWFPAAKTEKHPFFCKKYPDNIPKPTIPTTKAPTRNNCPANWVSYNNYCYFYNNLTLSFVDASEYCMNVLPSANLASIMDGAENDEVRNFFYNVSAVNSKFTWIGLTNEALTSGFRWTDGGPVKYINWLTNRPYSGNRHFCAGMNVNGFWEDTRCYAKYPSICKIFKGNLPPPTTTPPVTPTQDPSLCPSLEWVYFNGSCYYFSKKYTEEDDYNGASKACGEKKSTLVSILDDHENNFILQQRKKKYALHNRVMTGLTDFSTTSGWKWSDGSIFKFTNFADGEPSNTNEMESCVEIGHDGKWNDFSCNIKMYYVCKWHKDKLIPGIKIIPKDKGYCEDDWELYGRNCYLFKYGDGNQRQYEDAQQICRDNDGDLASIHSSYENAFILSQLYNVHSTVYIGLDDRIHERTFLWSDQSSVDYTNWYSRQPSSYGDEDCVEMYPYVNFDGRWNDVYCQKKNSFVCKKGSIQKTKPTQQPKTTANPEKSCPASYKKYQGSCYYFSDLKKTWSEADAQCKAMSDGRLVSIHSQFEQAYVFSHAVEYDNVTWVGLSRDKMQNDFNWSDQSDMDYSYWMDNNVPLLSNTSRQCVSQVYSTKSNGRWVAAADCNEKHSFVCKIFKRSETEVGFIGNCSEGWEKFKGKCYKYFKEYSDKATWSAARQKCVSYGGDLVTMDNFAVQKKMEFLVRDKTTTSVWMGLNDREKEHVFSWSSGVPFSGNSFSNWNLNEPNDNAGTENCVEFQAQTGLWNDLRCDRALPFICEHTLECRTPLGLQNGQLPDLSFDATSFYGMYYPKYARVNATREGKQMAWCTNQTKTPQALTVNLGQYQHITRITTQGLKEDRIESYVISYRLQYSKDGQNWEDYVSRKLDGSFSRNLPGNMDADKMEGNTLDVRAQYLRFTPVLFKTDRICLRLEIYGCSSICLNPLTAMATATSDSVYLPHPPTPLSSGTLCITGKPLSYVLRFVARVKITRIEVRSTDESFEYNLLFSSASGELVKFIIDGKEKVFTTAVEVYDLPTPIFTHQVTIRSINTVKSCIRVEMFGCVKDCDAAVGLSSQEKIPNFLITSKSELRSNPASQARLNTGEYNDNSWCSLVNDQNQYLQIDFTKTVQLTGIATQGFHGNIPKYVTRYYVQWSSDGDLWRQISSEFTGNNDGSSVVKVNFDIPVSSRYLRIIPLKYQNGICMRVELYGCPFSPEHKGHGGKSGERVGRSGDSSGLSNGGKIGLIVFFVLLIVVIFIVTAIYYFKHKHAGFVPHKSFENPVHIDMTNDEIDIINYAE